MLKVVIVRKLYNIAYMIDHEFNLRLTARTEDRLVLFGELPGTLGAHDEVVPSLAAIALGANLAPGITPAETAQEIETRQKVHERVSAVIVAQQQEARNPEATEAVLRVHNEAYVPAVSEIAAGVICVWERACKEEGWESPFKEVITGEVEPTDLAAEPVRRVIETAAAVCEVVQAGYSIDQLSSDEREQLTYLIASHGPAYLALWTRGDPIRRYSLDQHRSQSATDAWLHTVPVAKRAELLLNNPERPLGAAVDFIKARLAAERPPIVFPPELVSDEARGQDGWIANRQGYRDLLFDSIDRPIGPYRTTGSQASLALIDPLYMSSQELRKLDGKPGLPAIISRIIMQHDAVKAIDGAPAIFGIGKPEDLVDVISLTTQLVWAWEHSSERLNEPSLFGGLLDLAIEKGPDRRAINFDAPEVRCVIETAAAVCEVLQAGYHRVRLDDLARFVARYGPDFVAAWIRGDIVEKNYPNPQAWLDRHTLGQRAQVAFSKFGRKHSY